MTVDRDGSHEFPIRSGEEGRVIFSGSVRGGSETAAECEYPLRNLGAVVAIKLI